MTENTVEVFWEGPYSHDEVIRNFNLDNNERVDFGLYMIYGPHLLYSNKKRPQSADVLLYVGKTTKGSKFAGRIKRHAFCHDVGYKVYLGRVAVADDDIGCNIWANSVNDAEKLIINRYAPPYNACMTGDLRREQLRSGAILIKNSGELMDLEEFIDSEEIVYKR